MTTSARMIVFHAMKGVYANASTSMKIKLFISKNAEGKEWYFWELSNIYTGHRWFTEISRSTYDHMIKRLSANYRFVCLPMYQANKHANEVYENQYYM